MEPGLIEYLEDDRLQAFCYMRRLENLYLMTSGGRTPHSVELLSLEKMKNLIQYLRVEFDTIILDSPPLAPISDAEILSSLSDGVILVVRSGKTSYVSLERAVRSLDQTKLLGVVLNDVQPRMFNTQYDHSYYGAAMPERYPYGEIRRTPARHRSYLDLD